MSKIPKNFAAGMMTLALLILGQASDSFGEPFADIAMVTVGDAGNAADSTGYGSVAYRYSIGTYDVTVSQYAEFLNAVADADPFGVYATSMESNQNIAGISRSGGSGSYNYTVIGGSGNKPITFVTWFDAARFANWMANGQPNGPQSSSTTENGAYALSGATFGDAPVKNATNPNTGAAPTFYLPTENEWYKAAYYDPTLNSGTGGYWDFAYQSDSAPGNSIGASANQANYIFNGNYSVTQSSTYSASQNYLTDVGAFSGSVSHYGTYDQSGNVDQWNDLDGTLSSDRGIRGGYWWTFSSYELSNADRGVVATNSFDDKIGFRLAAPVPVPEPSTFALAVASAAILALRSRSLRRRLPETRTSL